MNTQFDSKKETTADHVVLKVNADGSPKIDSIHSIADLANHLDKPACALSPDGAIQPLNLSKNDLIDAIHKSLGKLFQNQQGDRNGSGNYVHTVKTRVVCRKITEKTGEHTFTPCCHAGFEHEDIDVYTFDGVEYSDPVDGYDAEMN